MLLAKKPSAPAQVYNMPAQAAEQVKVYKFLCLNRQNFESQTKRHTALSFYVHSM